MTSNTVTSSREHSAQRQRSSEAGRFRRFWATVSDNDEEEYFRRNPVLDGP